MPQLWVVAGPNGVGKSTLTAKYLEGRLQLVNPDIIARELNPSAPNGTRVRVQAGREAIRRQEAHLDNSSRRYRLLLSMEGGQVKCISRNLPDWASNVIPREMPRGQDLQL